jgi:large subunit ribosomal protein L30
MKIAAIQIRGIIGVKKPVKDTLKMLGFVRKNSCIVVENQPQVLGMLVKVKDYITWGEVDEKTILEMFTKRARLPGNELLSEDYMQKNMKMSIAEFVKKLSAGELKIKDVPGLKKSFRLTPPVGGFGNKGIKQPFSLGGALGYRAAKINDIIRRMI